MKLTAARTAPTRIARRPRATTQRRRRDLSNLLTTLDLCIDELEPVDTVSPKEPFDHEAVTMKVFVDFDNDLDDLTELPPSEFFLVG